MKPLLLLRPTSYNITEVILILLYYTIRLYQRCQILAGKKRKSLVHVADNFYKSLYSKHNKTAR